MSGLCRNVPCPCKSGKKYKKCCQAKELEQQQQAVVNRNAHWDRLINQAENPEPMAPEEQAKYRPRSSRAGLRSMLSLTAGAIAGVDVFHHR